MLNFEPGILNFCYLARLKKTLISVLKTQFKWLKKQVVCRPADKV
jgi:hypothetical protein